MSKEINMLLIFWTLFAYVLPESIILKLNNRLIWWLFIETIPSNFLWAHAVHLMCIYLQNKMNMLHCVLKVAKYTSNKNQYLNCHRFKGMIYSIQNLADISSFTPCLINLLLRILIRWVYFDNKFWLCCSFIKLL